MQIERFNFNSNSKPDHQLLEPRTFQCGKTIYVLCKHKHTACTHIDRGKNVTACYQQPYQARIG